MSPEKGGASGLSGITLIYLLNSLSITRHLKAGMHRGRRDEDRSVNAWMCIQPRPMLGHVCGIPRPRKAHRRVHVCTMGHGARLYRLLLCAGARLLSLLEVVHVEEVPGSKVSGSKCLRRTERSEPGVSGGASERLRGYTARPAVALAWSPEGGRAWRVGAASMGGSDLLGRCDECVACGSCMNSRRTVPT